MSALAAAIVGILLLALLKRREQVELQRDPAMARSHDAMGDDSLETRERLIQLETLVDIAMKRASTRRLPDA